MYGVYHTVSECIILYQSVSHCIKVYHFRIDTNDRLNTIYQIVRVYQTRYKCRRRIYPALNSCIELIQSNYLYIK